MSLFVGDTGANSVNVVLVGGCCNLSNGGAAQLHMSDASDLTLFPKCLLDVMPSSAILLLRLRLVV